jgi:hypothetical protein
VIRNSRYKACGRSPHESEFRQEHNDTSKKGQIFLKTVPFLNQVFNIVGPVGAAALGDTRCGMTIAGIDVADFSTASE